MERFPDAVAWGLDYSDVSVEKTRAVNKAAIEGGRCNVVQGDVTALPFDEKTFDLVTGFETVYFWPDIESCFRQVFRVLKPGGLFLIVNESDGTDAMGEKWEKMIDGMKLYKGEDLPLHAEGRKKRYAFLDGVLSGAVEPLGALLTIIATQMVLPAMPYLLSFAAGAMLYVVVEELIPEMSAEPHSDKGVFAFAVGFTLMMMLDVALG